MFPQLLALPLGGQRFAQRVQPLLDIRAQAGDVNMQLVLRAAPAKVDR